MGEGDSSGGIIGYPDSFKNTTPPPEPPAKEFLNTCGEWHAVWFGFIDAISIPKAGIPYDQEALDEPHYYRLGGFIGRFLPLILTFLAGVAYAIR